jgi:hypothetical protein
MADVERITPPLPTLPPVGRGTDSRDRPTERPRKPRPEPSSEHRGTADQPPDHIDEYV